MRVEIDMRAVSDAFRLAPQVIMRELARGAKEGLEDMRRDARVAHRFKTRGGALGRAVKVDFNNFAGRGLFIDSGIAPYGGYVHDGTRPHKIAPRNKAALSFIGKSGKHVLVPKKINGYWRGQGAITGAIVSSKGFVNHPGTKPDPFIYEAAQRGTPNLVNKMTQGVVRAIVKMGLKGKI
jgi:hypothetical protein